MYHNSAQLVRTSEARRFPVGTGLVSVRAIGIRAATNDPLHDSGTETPSSDGDKPRPYGDITILTAAASFGSAVCSSPSQ